MPDSVEKRIDAIACWGSCQGDFDRTDDILWLATLGSTAYAALKEIESMDYVCIGSERCDLRRTCGDEGALHDSAVVALAEIRAAEQ